MKGYTPENHLILSFSDSFFTINTSIMKTFIFQRNLLILFVPVLIVLITGCAQNEAVDQCLTGHTYGFFGGLWHGFIAPFDFIAMLFNDEITMYAQNNNGGLYALGFLLGSGGWGFFGGRGVRRVQHTRVNYQSQKFDNAEIVE